MMKCPWLDGNHVVFGEVVKGRELIKDLEEYASVGGPPVKDVTIFNCGEIHQKVDNETFKTGA